MGHSCQFIIILSSSHSLPCSNFNQQKFREKEVGCATIKIHILNQFTGADLAFFQGGGGLTQRRCGASSTSRVAASRFFLLFWTPVIDVFLASTNAMETIVHEPRSGEPIFFVLFWTPVSDVFLASSNAMETIVHEPRSGEPICFAILNPRKWCFPGIY